MQVYKINRKTMTDQAKEILIYRNETFRLNGRPLDPFLEKNKNIIFDRYTTGHWRGYQGSWLLKDDNLYITDLESSNYTFEDIFFSKEPVLADWYSGILNFEIGEYSYEHKGATSNVWLYFENGKVVEKKITKNFNSDYPISFGKYKGKKLKDILYGKINSDTFTTIKELFESVLSFLTQKDYPFKVQCGHFKIKPEDIELVNNLRLYRINYFLTPNSIVISTQNFWINSYSDEIAEKLSELLEKIFQSDFTVPIPIPIRNYYNSDFDIEMEPDGSYKTPLTITFTEEIEITEISENSVLINPDIDYLNWALKNVDFFIVNPIYLNETYTLKFLKSFKTTRLNKTIFEYEPIIESIEYIFPDYIKNINNKKFEKANKVLVDFENKLIVPNLTEEGMMLQYGFYLDETYEPSISNENDYYEQQSYGQFAGSYAQDVEGLSDNFISDALDGDPDAYWNID